jgi:2,3-bisphosphoglycerate-dependent phosphoglycerate mutase
MQALPLTIRSAEGVLMTTPRVVQILFDTHCTSLDNEANLASGHEDSDLSPRGERQAAALGARRRDSGVEVVYTSDLRRAWRTAEIAFSGTGIAIVRDGRLRECDYGALTRHPMHVLAAYRERAVVEPFPGGESYTQATARVALWLDELRAGDLRRVLVVAHRATHYALDHLLLGVPLKEAVAKPLQWHPGWAYEARALER